MTERQKMISGQLYKSGVKELVNDRMICKEQCYDFNALRPSQTEQQTVMIKKIFGKVGANCFITAPFWCDYGYNIEAGDNFYANHNLVILDCAKVTLIGNKVTETPGVIAKIMRALNAENITLLQSSDSYNSLSCLVDEKDMVTTVHVIHNAFSV